MRRVLVLVLVVIVANFSAAYGSASGAESIDGSAVPTSGAERGATSPSIDVVSVYESGPLSAATRTAALAAATDAGAAAVVGRTASIGLRRVTRLSEVVQAAPGESWQYPMGLTVLPSDAVFALMGPAVSAVVARGELVMNQTSADMRGARAGDIAHLVAASGQVRQIRIGLVAPDDAIGGAEFLAGEAVAGAIGLTREYRVLIWGGRSRQEIDAALRDRGLVSSSIRIRRSWDPPDPDSGIGMVQTKVLLGEFAYTVSSAGSVSLSSDWTSANVTDRITYRDIAIKTRCHRLVSTALQGALSEVAAQGLSAGIDVTNTNTYGGCYYPRFNRLTGQLGFLSRHSWGQAFDTNTVTNAQGATPRMDCRIVGIFRSWGFAWGGNFLTPDGMHFEYVGEPRNTLAYPSRYCPNPVAASQSIPQRESQEMGIGSIFESDGLDITDHID